MITSYSHVQTNGEGEFLRKIPQHDIVQWDDNNYCSAFALEADGKAAEFKVFPFYTTAEPVHDYVTQSVAELPPILVDGNWTQQWEVIELLPEQIAAKQFNSDEARYKKRAAAKDGLIAYMAADNMSRVRNGTWTVPELMSLLDDPAIAAANAYMSTLSYELAAQAIAGAETPLLTPEIREDWIARLQAHFYLEG